MSAGAHDAPAANGGARGPRPRAHPFDRFANAVTRAVGTSTAFLIAFACVLVWGALGPLMNYSEEWQLVINTATTIVTFLMVFVIQQSQNRDSIAMHLKLDELIASHTEASNRVLRAEKLNEEELEALREQYCRLAEEAERHLDARRASKRDPHAKYARGATPEASD